MPKARYAAMGTAIQGSIRAERRRPSPAAHSRMPTIPVLRALATPNWASAAWARISRTKT